MPHRTAIRCSPLPQLSLVMVSYLVNIMGKQQINYIRLMILVCALLTTPIAKAFDYTDRISDIKEFGHWQVVEFAGPGQIGYRLATTSIIHPNIHIAFDFLPSKNCLSAPAIMIIKYDSYIESLDDGLVILTYKFPKEKKQTTEFVKTEMSKRDSFAFLLFQKLTTKKFYRAGDKGKLAIWVPGVYYFAPSDNMYFSLDGFMSAYKEAKKSCTDNMNR